MTSLPPPPSIVSLPDPVRMTSSPGVPLTMPLPVIVGVKPKHEVGSADAAGAPIRANASMAANTVRAVGRGTMRSLLVQVGATPARAEPRLTRRTEVAQGPQTAPSGRGR